MGKWRILLPALLTALLLAGCGSNTASGVSESSSSVSSEDSERKDKQTERMSSLSEAESSVSFSEDESEIQNYTRYTDYTPVRAEDAGVTAGTNRNMLVAYFTRSVNTSLDGIDAMSSASLNIGSDAVIGNAQRMAEWIADETGGDLYPIQTMYTYPVDYEQTVDVGEGQDIDGVLPKLINPVDLSSYDAIYLVYPVWHYTLPAPMVSFLTDYDLSGKMVFCYTTSAGSGFADTIERIQKAEPDANVIQGITVSQNQIDDAEEDVRTSASLLMSEYGAEQEEAQMNHPIQITIGNQTFTAELEENDAAKALMNELPLTLDMNELNGNEKYAYGVTLPSQAEAVASIQSGDLMLYGDDCLVLFYDSFSTSYSYTRIGHIINPDGLADAVGSGNITITFSD